MITKDDFMEHYVDCPKFGGTRQAPACIHFDRYKPCRRNCKSIRNHLEKYPDFPKIVAEYFSVREKENPGIFTMGSKYAGKNLPDPELACRYCKFIAKTVRGLRIHYKRSHPSSKEAEVKSGTK
jgi:hypothetical protein